MSSEILSLYAIHKLNTTQAFSGGPVCGVWQVHARVFFLNVHCARQNRSTARRPAAAAAAAAAVQLREMKLYLFNQFLSKTAMKRRAFYLGRIV